MYGAVKQTLAKELEEIRSAGLFKDERIILTPQGADISVKEGEVINFCANNYLGLSNNPELVAAAKEGLEKHGFGMSSVRFICGTQDIHKELEREISTFLGTDDTILYTSCFDANGGLFETLLDKDCSVISDQLNHASIIDGIRLCKAERRRFAHNDMADLEKQLKETQGAKARMVATDGVFSMDGDIARLDQICDLADKYDAMVMVDDSHATGFVGKTGRGSPEHRGVQGRVDIITSTLGKALGGASGGFTSGRQEIVDMLRQRSRPYLFSNTLAPAIVYAGVRVFRLLKKTTELRDRLEENTLYFRKEMTARGFDIMEGVHPIVPIMLGEAKLAADMAQDLLVEGIYVIGFSYPVVPKGEARIRVQLSAAHTREHLDKAIEAFAKIGKKYGVI
ncbi:2-amino-3-ketobutyrate CoA ligase [candidate division TA06 bacterium DG_24]|jgi:glycine C-acetyltransferase|uniref:2-amino-3-ketobutyrate coenzyme A ligase n=3 Tax=Bacteria division TA06 TaxID=1156500 RepID=A0A0S8JKB0_UNCT6|nr:MAG: 2-amino-3-ketobutyrate CoA ligase [candidate division TA06 bacterium DG_24]KPK71574.1 MAG: 2-amino-3-ketobutyrate CoA ligase [candidate division TA06 bacterium SM23_40]KPL10191.1 MAG: 2-amino-3-ketobutyrate CoA ligase [candidate division TA06 bacterium SM1_40]